MIEAFGTIFLISVSIQVALWVLKLITFRLEKLEKQKNDEVEKPKRKNDDEQPLVGLWAHEHSLPAKWMVGDDGEIVEVDSWTS